MEKISNTVRIIRYGKYHVLQHLRQGKWVDVWREPKDIRALPEGVMLTGHSGVKT